MAYVNAELVRVTAPMAGRLARDLPRKGEIIDHSITVRLTETIAPDRRHLANLEQQTAVAKDRAALAERQLVEIAAVDRELEARANAYQSGMMQRLGQEIAGSGGGKGGLPRRGSPAPCDRHPNGANGQIGGRVANSVC